MPHVPQTFFDALAVRTWCGLALEALGRVREELDAINVYPVADGDTGTNLYLTVESAVTAVESAFAGGSEGAERVGGAKGAEGSGGAGSEWGGPTLAEAAHAMAHGALIGARGNSGTILAQLLRGMAQILAGDEGGGGTGAGTRTDAGTDAGTDTGADAGTGTRAGTRAGVGLRADGPGLRLALRHAADEARRAVAHPVEGTVLTVASAAADAAGATGGEECAEVAWAAYEGAREALAATPGQLAVLREAGVVDAGGQGLVALLAALVEALTGRRPADADAGTGAVAAGERDGAGHPRVARVDGAEAFGVGDACSTAWDEGGPGYEVIYLLEAGDEAVARLRERLDPLGDSLVVVGGDGLWRVHVHVDDAGAAVEAGVEAGRPSRIRITHFGQGDVYTALRGAAGVGPAGERPRRAVVAVVPGEGLAGLYGEAGATVVLARPGEPPAADDLLAALRRTHAREVVLLPNDEELRNTAAAAAEEARAGGIRVALIPTRSAVQGIAALAVHEPEHRFDEDVVAMTSAAGTTRYAEITVAERQFWTTAGICQAGDVLGLIEGDVALIGSDVTQAAESVLDRMLAAGGELVTLVLGEGADDALADHLEARVRERHLAVDTVVYRGGRQGALLLVGVE